MKTTAQEILNQSPFLKVIAGIENFDAASIRTVAQAADGVAQAIDLSADEASVRWVKEKTQLTVFVSSLDPATLAKSVEWGTDWVELGNFQPIYDRGALINPEMVMGWTRELVAAVAGRAGICVTIPGILSLEDQITLAKEVQAAGADLIQIENISGDLSHVQPIAEALEIPVMVAGLLTSETLPAAVKTGAAGYGIGSVIRKAGDLQSMRALISQLQAQLSAVSVK